MLENTDKIVSELLAKLPDIIQSASNQLPEIAQQMLAYGAFSATVGVVVGLLLAILGSISLFLASRSHDGFGYFIVGFLFVFASLLIIPINTSELYKIKYAPKVYLLNQANGFIKCKS